MRKSKAGSVVGVGLRIRQNVSGLAAMVVLFAVPLFADLPRAVAQASDSATTAGADLAPTSTELSVATDDSGPRTRARFTARVNGDATPATGVVTLSDARGPLGSVALGSDGVATFDVDELRPGTNRIVANYSGSTVAKSSNSPAVVVSALDSGVPDYGFALNPTNVTVKAGTDGTIIATITPTNGFNQLVSLSCAGNGVPLPVGVTCLFTPVNLVPSASGAAVTSSLNIQTTGVAGQTSLQPLTLMEHHPLYAVLLPGIIAFAGLRVSRKRAFGAVRLLSLLSLMCIAGLGLSSCAARYHYLHNPPAANDGTPLGTYTLIITASSSSTSSITIHSLPITLTVK